MNSKTSFFFTIAFLLGYSTLAQVKNHAVYTRFRLPASERSALRQELSRENGPYLLFQGGMRKHSTDQENYFPLYRSSLYHGIVTGIYGYRINNTSFEVGMGFIWHVSRNLHELKGFEKSVPIYSNFNSINLPIGFRYDIPTGTKQNFRFGAHTSLNLLIHQTRKPRNPDILYHYFTQWPSTDYVDYVVRIEDKGLTGFFKIGIHTEIKVFKSSSLLLQLSRAVSPSPSRVLNVNWKYQNQSGSFRDEVKLEGTIVELAYKLPLNILNPQKSIPKS
ncbi:hypothetical protein [Algoriphagus mannitolivorans]|uniref:hypothetical protein n=1 Tax=Algoriphagus mannitolivorans TaxID=226504 RepID=UPI0012FBE07F|nr:hypothetical protein [Algoriphagus mannitolivorans]